MKSLKEYLIESQEKNFTSLDLINIHPLFPKEGIQAGSIIELLGGSHSGKSYLSYKLAINSIIQSDFKAKVLYIESKNYFDPRQCSNLSHELLNKNRMDNGPSFDNILKNIIIIRVKDWKQYFNLLVKELNEYLMNNSDVNLVVIDEFLQLHKLSEGLSDNLKNQLLPAISQSVIDLTKKYSKLSIIACSKILLPLNDSQIGYFNFNRIINTNTDLWSTVPTHRIWLYRHENKRRAMLIKSNDLLMKWINLID